MILFLFGLTLGIVLGRNPALIKEIVKSLIGFKQSFKKDTDNGR